MQRQEIKKRFSLAKMLTTITAIVIIFVLIKYGLEVYRILVADHVTVEAEMG